jgi:hypothetical protein
LLPLEAAGLAHLRKLPLVVAGLAHPQKLPKRMT